MKILKHPVPTTVFYGLTCGLSFVPLNQVFNAVFFWPNAICLILWLFIVGYALLLGFWSKKDILPLVFPLLTLLMTVFLVKSITAYLLVALAVMGWIRSGICFQERGGIKLMVEILLSALGGALFTIFPPGTTFTWALATWMFFLLQALYFTIFDIGSPTPQPEPKQTIDPFERASRDAQDILTRAEIL